ncbi:unnamed protein product [Rhizophagus irregularis]|nr:unnamed protein product [Rhizophagus irregularis]
MEHNQMEHTLNVPYNNNFNISRDPLDTTIYTTGNYEESSFMDNQLVNSPQPDNSEIFRLSIPGFKIIVIPNSVNLANLDLQNLFPQDSTPNIVTENLQTHSQNTFGLNDSSDFNNF